MALFSFIWRRLGSLNLTIFLCAGLALDLAWGYFCLSRRATLFAPLNEVGLTNWIRTYGASDLPHTGWLFLLFGLLFLFGVNTFVCTTDRVVRLFKARRHFPGFRFFSRLAPHVMHYAVIVILSGYLGSYLGARVLDTRTLVPGGSLALPGTEATITFEDLDPVYYEGEGLPAFKDRVLKPRARLLLAEGGRETSAILDVGRPVRFKGYGIFLKNFNPTLKSGGMSGRTRIDLSIRRDPGVVFYLFGIGLFTVGLVMYLTELAVYKRKKETP